MTKTDRRVQRTRELLQKALIDLIRERGYDAVTIQDIADRANVARTTFYVHYSGKDDLFLSCHTAIINDFQSGLFFLHPLSMEELMSAQTPSNLIQAYQHIDEARTDLNLVFQGKDGPLLLRRIRDQSAHEIEANLRAAFAESGHNISFDLLAIYLAGAQIALVQWWMEKRRSCTAEQLAETFHRLRQSAIREALAFSADEQV